MVPDGKAAVGRESEEQDGAEDLRPAVKRYKRYLEDNGLIVHYTMYALHVAKYLKLCETYSPNIEPFARFRDHLLLDKKVSRNA